MIETGDYYGRPWKIATDTNADGTSSPKYGFSDVSTALFTSLIAALSKLAPATKHSAVTPSDSTVLTGVQALFIGTAGNVVVTLGGVDATYKVLDGQVLVVAAEKVKAATTAANIVAMGNW